MIVYLDTNVYKSAKYAFDTGKLNTLKNLVKDGKVSVLYTSATVGEINQHIEEDISNAVDKYNRILNKEMPALKDENIYSLREINVNDAVQNVKQKLNEFLGLNGVNKISLNPIDAEKLLEDYFLSIPPFEKKKPNEFKDAIMVNAVKKYQKSINETICIVSGDEGFRKAFDGDDGFIVFDYLGYFLKYCYNQEVNEMMKYTIKEVENGEFDDVIKDYLNDVPINMDCYVQFDCRT